MNLSCVVSIYTCIYGHGGYRCTYMYRCPYMCGKKHPSLSALPDWLSAYEFIVLLLPSVWYVTCYMYLCLPPFPFFPLLPPHPFLLSPPHPSFSSIPLPFSLLSPAAKALWGPKCSPEEDLQLHLQSSRYKLTTNATTSLRLAPLWPYWISIIGKRLSLEALSYILLHRLLSLTEPSHAVQG